jgi:hypothetical protein
LEEFCLTIDGYEAGRYTIDDLLEFASQVERSGWSNASLEDLRRTAFIRQRELRWADGSTEEVLEVMVLRIRAIVDEIRARFPR